MRSGIGDRGSGIGEYAESVNLTLPSHGISRALGHAAGGIRPKSARIDSCSAMSMPIESHRDLHVWQLAMQLAADVDALAASVPAQYHQETEVFEAQETQDHFRPDHG